MEEHYGFNEILKVPPAQSASRLPGPTRRCSPIGGERRAALPVAVRSSANPLPGLAHRCSLIGGERRAALPVAFGRVE